MTVMRVLDGAALVTLALVIASSVAQPLLYYDSWMYHLAFSALMWDIGDARRVFVLSAQMAARYDGFPVAAEWIQGALWKLTGTINATTLINSCGFALYAIVAARALGASLAVLVFAALTAPLAALHASSGYIDLFVGCCVAFQALAAVKLEALLGRRSGAANPRSVLIWCAVYVAGAALAGNSKVTGPVLSGSITVFFALYLVWRRAEYGRSGFKVLLPALAVASLLSGATVIRNAMVYGNPLYPFDTTIAGVKLSGPEAEELDYPRYTERLGPLARPANWVLSVSEIDWLVRGVRPHYTLDSATGDHPVRDGRARTGGYGGALVVLTAALAVGLALRAARSNRAAFGDRRFLLALFVFITAVTTCMPRSHELRYYLHWLVLLFTVTAALVPIAITRPPMRAMIALAYLAAFIASQQIVGSTLDLSPVIGQSLRIQYETGLIPVERVRAARATCLGPAFTPNQFAYSAVFHGGDYVVEQGLLGCSRLRELKPGSDPNR